MVFSKGTLNGFSGLIPIGGQVQPTSTVGTKLLWKNAQKNPKKKQISDVINRIIPIRSPFTTYDVWLPAYVDSRITSRHHRIIDKIIIIIPIDKHIIPWLWNHLVRPIVSAKAPADEVSGQGLGSTKWKGCRVNLIFFWFIYFRVVVITNINIWYLK